MKVQSLTIRGYKSLRALEEFQLRDLNIIVGANGAGKSNFLSFFKFASALAQGNLQTYIQQQGGPDALLYGTRKNTPRLDLKIVFQSNLSVFYNASLMPTVDNRLIFFRERAKIYTSGFSSHTSDEHLESLRQEYGSPIQAPSSHVAGGHSESMLPEEEDDESIANFRAALQSWKQYHFNDTSDSAAVKGTPSSSDNLVLKAAADNLAPYLLRLRLEYPAYYQRIIDTIKLAAPFFGGFVMRKPVPENIQLEWFEQRDPDTPYKAHVLSDGTLRFICLATLLMQPPELLPDTVLLDEPELGLHPYAINLLADMLKQVAEEKQVLVATQSVELLNCFKPEDVVVAERQDDATILKRLDTEELKDWLEDYSLGELWKRNIFGGRPA